MQEVSKKKAALEKIATIRRNGFDPGDEIKKLLLNCRPTRALAIIRFTARADRAWWPYH